MIISIASTFYNDKKMLKIVMDSILSQTYSDVEHCVADGGSTDGSIELLKEYEVKYRNAGKVLKWTSERDNNRPDGMNKAVNMTTGEYIFVAFFDPFANKESLYEVVSYLKKGDYDYIHGGLYYQQDGKIIRKWDGKNGNWRLGWMMATPTLCVKRSIWEKHGPFDTNLSVVSEDYRFQISLFQDSTLKHTAINKKIVLYYAGGASNGSLHNQITAIKVAYNVLKGAGVKGAFFINLCKTIRGVCSYIFVIRKKIDINNLK